LEIEDQAQLLEWFANNYKNFGTTLQIVTDKSQEGSQFCKGFGGIGGMLLFLQSLETGKIHKLNLFLFENY
jgi:peptide chain release factor subunit 1